MFFIWVTRKHGLFCETLPREGQLVLGPTYSHPGRSQRVPEPGNGCVVPGADLKEGDLCPGGPGGYLQRAEEQRFIEHRFLRVVSG